jgi:hypothetical protein
MFVPCINSITFLLFQFASVWNNEKVIVICCYDKILVNVAAYVIYSVMNNVKYNRNVTS